MDIKELLEQLLKLPVGKQACGMSCSVPQKSLDTILRYARIAAKRHCEEDDSYKRLLNMIDRHYPHIEETCKIHNVIRVKVTTYNEYLLCPNCQEKMLAGGYMLMSNPPKYEHRCPKCECVDFRDTYYPKTIHVEE